jgi:5-formyltetrahydrofolate cyclo-ligase
MADAAGGDEKAALRRRAHKSRAALSEDFRAEAAQRVAGHFFAHFHLNADDTVAGYWAIRDELDCGPILARLQDAGQRVLLPVVMGPDRPLDWRVWEQHSPLSEAGFGTLAPSEHAPRATPDIVLLPMLGFDANSTRLGYGGGYYDRTLAGLERRPRLVGLAFAAQELPEIPRHAHDMPLDAVITEQGVRFFEQSA